MIYTVDIYLKSGTVMRDVTVKELDFDGGSVSWQGGGDNGLVFLSRADVAGVVERNREEETPPA